MDRGGGCCIRYRSTSCQEDGNPAVQVGCADRTGVADSPGCTKDVDTDTVAGDCATRGVADIAAAVQPHGTIEAVGCIGADNAAVGHRPSTVYEHRAVLSVGRKRV